MNEIKALYLKYVQAGFPSKEAAKKVQMETGLSAVTGKPLSDRGEPYKNKEGYKGQYGN